VAEPLKPIGFWSYTSSDDTRSGGRLSQLRRLLADELQLLIGRRQQVHIFQDVAAIPHGADWLKEIHKALGESSFLIPIVTPAFLESEMCCLEVTHFHQREQELGRGDLIFPFRYIDVSDMERKEAHDPAVLDLLNSRQWFDFAPLRHRPPDTEEVATRLAALAGSIRAALRRAVAPEPPPEEPAAKAKPEPPRPAVPRSPERPRPVVVPPTKPPPVPRTVTRDVPVPEMALIPVGHFLMGVPEAESKREGTDDSNARPQHQVTIARPFWLGKFPVTRGEYAAFAVETGRGNEPWASTTLRQNDRHPVVNVRHADALAYLDWLSEKTGQTYRLPSEAEWEYAARAGTTSARHWGEDAGKPGEHAHFSEIPGSAGGTCPAGSFSPNAFGLHDMLGNVWEWTADPWHGDYQGAPSDGSAWTAGGAAYRVVRGGSCSAVARFVRAACRYHFDPADRFDFLGFRCGRVQE